MAYQLTQHQINGRVRLRKLLEKGQKGFYAGNKRIDKRQFKSLVVSGKQSRFIYPSEADTIKMWIECWGFTIDGNPAPLDYVWEHDTHPCARGGMTQAARRVAI